MKSPAEETGIEKTKTKQSSVKKGQESEKMEGKEMEEEEKDEEEEDDEEENQISIIQSPSARNGLKRELPKGGLGVRRMEMRMRVSPR